MPHTCTKRYADIPFTHRQPFHDGHCRFLHGHNWTFVFTFACTEREPLTGFVIDYGKLKWLKHWIEDEWDHAFVVQSDDPELSRWEELAEENLVKLHEVPDSSCEGLAEYLFREVNTSLKNATQDRVRLVAVEVLEDSKNSATFHPGEI